MQPLNGHHRHSFTTDSGSRSRETPPLSTTPRPKARKRKRSTLVSTAWWWPFINSVDGKRSVYDIPLRGGNQKSTCSRFKSVKLLIVGDDVLPDVYELPPHLFDILVKRLPPLPLHKLQEHMPFCDCSGYESTDDSIRTGRKRGRTGNFEAAWMALFKLRWPEVVVSAQSIDWLQLYWETHLQNCLNEAAELASLPSFNGCIGEVQISDAILKCIGCEGHTNYSKLSYHCLQFGQYARSLRLQGIIEELQVADFVFAVDQVDGLCKLLVQNKETLTSLEFIYCKLSETFVNAICQCLDINNKHAHGIQSFSISTSSFLEPGTVSLPVGLASFLSSGRSLYSLRFCENYLDHDFARVLFSTLIDTSSSLSLLDLSYNNIAGWLSHFHWRSTSNNLSSLETSNFLQSLNVLKIRGNNLQKNDMESLRDALAWMPNLETLDISENPIEDDGIRSLIPYFVEVPERRSTLTKLSLGSCELSVDGVTQLLNTLLTSKVPLSSLSIADNDLGSLVAKPLGRFLASPIKSLDIEGIGLGSFGFQELQKEMPEESKLVKINISKNRGLLETARFLSRLISLAPEITTVNASYNLMPLESLTIICSALKLAKGNLECLDLTGNNWDYQSTHSSILAEFQHKGRSILILPSSRSSDFPYDDDP
ncbi:hypothetical protein Tsubulata_037619 [Turnera subulata]|uniref:Uncharacterized protein n=1 Tax=Turnera subulata TaxID=218843 RepID=A0A9Q0GHH1_9ROSI|nr:hypothetical protein Tsubulata_037619 [Turnera subulata]